MDRSIDTAAEEPGQDRLPGYNNMVLGRDEFPCPFEPREPPCAPESPPPCAPWSVPSVTREGAVEALRRYASERGLDPRPAAEARVSHMEALRCFRYRLETFTERRVTRWTLEPFTGEEQEPEPDASSEPPPQPWDFPVEEPLLFRANTKNLPVPGTAVVQDCILCRNRRGSVESVCLRCTNGKVTCPVCRGPGWTYSFTPQYTTTSHCYSCGGTGRTRCLYCHGFSRDEKCPRCREHKKTVRSITLRVMWSVQTPIFGLQRHLGHSLSCYTWIPNMMNYPDQVLCGEQDLPHAAQLPGLPLMTHSAPRVRAVSEFPEPSLVEASQRLVQEHSDKYVNGRVLQQRQTIELLALTRVSYVWRGRTYSFHIGAADGAAIVDDYPQSSCQCCGVM